MTPHITPAEYLRDALSNAKASGLNLDDCIAAAEHADTIEAFNRAVNLMPADDAVVYETSLGYL